MFGKLFKKEKKEEIYPLEELVLSYLEKNGIPGNAGNKQLNTSVEERIQTLLNQLKYPEEAIEQLIMEQWSVTKATNPDITPSLFARHFIMGFHNLEIEPFAPDFIKERNRKFEHAYVLIVNVISKMQALLEDEMLRVRIESDFTKDSSKLATMIQCTTAFAIVSLGCDQLGRYNLVYSLDHRIQKMLPEIMIPMLPNRIHELTAGGMEPFVKIGSFSADCISILQQIGDEVEKKNYHHFYCEPKIETTNTDSL